MLKVSVSGVRGIWGDELVPSSIVAFAQAFGYLVLENLSSHKDRPTVLISSDTRPTSGVFRDLVSSTLRVIGINVIDAGVLATPLLLFAVRHQKAHGGIVLTASHNPVEWNAFKFINQQGFFVSSEEIHKIQQSVHKDKHPPISFSNIGNISFDYDICNSYLKTILPYFAIEKIKTSNIRIVADVINGTASYFFPSLMHELGLSYKMVHNTVNGIFERPAEPKPENLSVLCKTVKESQASVGFAFDPDGDRLALVDENGQPMGENWTLVIAYLCFLEFHAPSTPDIVVNLSTSMLIDMVAKRFGGTVVRTPVGELNVTERLLFDKIPIGGEGNGGVILPVLNPCRDSMIAVLFVLEYLTLTGKTLSQIMSEFKIPHSINQSINLTKIPTIQTCKNFLGHLATQHELNNLEWDEQDGLKLTYSQGWIQLRSSNTEPILRIMGESFLPDIQNALLTEIHHWLPKLK